jgi:hypothetical protein
MFKIRQEEYIFYLKEKSSSEIKQEIECITINSKIKE